MFENDALNNSKKLQEYLFIYILCTKYTQLRIYNATKRLEKNADGQYPQPSSKENELISIDDILFPRTTIQKLAKNIVSDDETMLVK